MTASPFPFCSAFTVLSIDDNYPECGRCSIAEARTASGVPQQGGKMVLWETLDLLSETPSGDEPTWNCDAYCSWRAWIDS
jgi:hypothetical protein